MPKIIDNPMQTILDHAKEIIRIEGYMGLNIRKVAESSGLAIGTIYNYFPTKNDLVARIMTDYWEEYFVVFRKIEEQDTDFYHKLREIFSQLDLFVNRFHETWVKVNTEIEYTEDGLQRKKNFTERLIRKMESLILGEIKNNPAIHANIDAPDFARFIILNFITMTQFKEFEYDSFEKIVKMVLI